MFLSKGTQLSCAKKEVCEIYLKYTKQTVHEWKDIFPELPQVIIVSCIAKLLATSNKQNLGFCTNPMQGKAGGDRGAEVKALQEHGRTDIFFSCNVYVLP